MNDYSYYENNLKLVAKMKRESSHMISDWFRHFVLVASSIFGILIAFYDKNNLQEHYQYIVAIVLLALSILFGLFASYQEAFFHKKTAKCYAENIEKALKSNQYIEGVFLDKPVLVSISEIACIVSFAFSIILFCITILISSSVFL